VTAALELWRRRASDVTVLELAQPRDLNVAEKWLKYHGADVVRWHPTIGDAVKFRQRHANRWQTAALGQRLVRHIRSGRFEVLDAADFLADHTPRLKAVPDSSEGTSA
jgi:hypothetical protein